MADSCLYRADAAAVVVDLERIIARYGARQVFVPAAEDHHEDHQATVRFAMELRARRPDWTFHCYPVWSRWDDPDFEHSIAHHSPIFLPLRSLRTMKHAAINAHRTQLGQVRTAVQK